MRQFLIWSSFTALTLGCPTGDLDTDPGGTSTSTASSESSGPLEFRYVLVEDRSDGAEGGTRLDAIQRFDGAADHYAVAAMCITGSAGADIDPGQLLCDSATGVKELACDPTDETYVKLGGPGGSAVGEFEAPFVDGDVVTAHVCGAEIDSYRLHLGASGELDASDWIPCEVAETGSCIADLSLNPAALP